MYIPCLDGLRAIAILLVIIAHIVSTGLPENIKDVIESVNAGTIGVRLFFIISGFLITYILKTEFQKNGTISIKNFFIRRFLRIFPAFYFYLFVLLILKYFDVLSIDSNAIFFSFLYIQNINMFQNQDLFTTSKLVKHSWSLSVEEQFYIIYPFVFQYLKKIITKNTLIIAILISTICTTYRVINYSEPNISRILGGFFFMHCDYLLYGCILAIKIESYKSYLIKYLEKYKYILLIVSFIVVFYSSKVEYYSAINILICGNTILFGNLYILIFVILFPNSIFGNMLETSFMKKIGVLSYSLYIWQQPFTVASGQWNKYQIVSTFPYNIISIIFCAYFSYRVIETPFLMLKKKYSNNK